MTLARWMHLLWENNALHLHNLIYHSREDLQLSNDLVQELLVIEERVAAAGTEGILPASLPRHVADSIARLNKVGLLEVQCKEDRVFLSFEPLFDKLLKGRMGDGDVSRQYMLIMEEVQEEIRRLEDLRNRQVLERRQIDEERKALLEREERLASRDDDLRRMQLSLMEKDQSLHLLQMRLAEEERQFQEERRQLDQERSDLEGMRRELDDAIKLHTERQTGYGPSASAGALPLGAPAGYGAMANGAGSSAGLSAAPGYGPAAALGGARGSQFPPSVMEDNGPLMHFLQQLRGGAANAEEARDLRKIQMRHHWSDAFLLDFLQAAARGGVRAIPEFRRQAEMVAAWGIAGSDKLAEFFGKKTYLEEKVYEVWLTLGSPNKINDIFRDTYVKWSQTWGFSHEVILRACQEAYKGAANPSINYVDKVLSRWHEAGVRTVEDGEREIDRFRQQRSRGGGGRPAGHLPHAASASQRGPQAGVNVVPKSEEEAKAYEQFRDL
ncbi:DnaD domain protein [Heliobacterium gestii]|uniref:DnaD domain protein n=1 Tax=Heliomicrobium gestii TaxID=2699 RepID=A0A845LFJ9_HELGE|nr:DnaD domain protein [Heliomicrobium gestii]MBM7867791.1 DnaD/phage-associated family protein [Heliomicrobium gestii]MZP44184.1 DnaD domain protein [Heliomicrobium gestii]